MADLKKLMDEYKLRINDPTYVVPKELRNSNRSNASTTIGVSQRPQNTTNAVRPESIDQSEQLAKYMEMKRLDPSSVVRESEVNGNNGAFKYSGGNREELARKLGLGWRDNQPEMDEHHEAELHKAIGKSTEVKNNNELNEREQQLLDLFTDWRG